MTKPYHILTILCCLLTLAIACNKDEPSVPAEPDFPPLQAMYGTVDSKNFTSVDVYSRITTINSNGNMILNITAGSNGSDEIIGLSYYPFELEPATFQLATNNTPGNQYLSANYRDKNGNSQPATSGIISIYSCKDSIAKGYYDFTTTRGTVVKGRFTVFVH